MSVNRDKIITTLLKALTHPLGAAGPIIDFELSLGARLLPFGSYKPFEVTSSDWNDAIITILDKEARIIAVDARRPGSGALHRLVDRIYEAGYSPVIVEPTRDAMLAVLKHWDWEEKIVGSTFEDRRREWRPRARPPAG